MNIDAKFEKINKYAEDNDVIVPFRKTSASAGYDFYCAEDTVIPSFASTDLWNRVSMEMAKD